MISFTTTFAENGLPAIGIASVVWAGLWYLGSRLVITGDFYSKAAFTRMRYYLYAILLSLVGALVVWLFFEHKTATNYFYIIGFIVWGLLMGQGILEGFVLLLIVPLASTWGYHQLVISVCGEENTNKVKSNIRNITMILFAALATYLTYTVLLTLK